MLFILQRIRANVNSTEQKRLLMDLDVSMRVTDCPYTVHFYGALFREVCQLSVTLLEISATTVSSKCPFGCLFVGYFWKGNWWTPKGIWNLCSMTTAISSSGRISSLLFICSDFWLSLCIFDMCPRGYDISAFCVFPHFTCNHVFASQAERDRLQSNLNITGFKIDNHSQKMSS